MYFWWEVFHNPLSSKQFVNGKTTNASTAEGLSQKLRLWNLLLILIFSWLASGSPETVTNFSYGKFIYVSYTTLFRRMFNNYQGIAYGAKWKLSKTLYLRYIWKQWCIFSRNHVEFASLSKKPSDKCITKLTLFLWYLCRYCDKVDYIKDRFKK